MAVEFPLCGRHCVSYLGAVSKQMDISAFMVTTWDKINELHGMFKDEKYSGKRKSREC